MSGVPDRGDPQAADGTADPGRGAATIIDDLSPGDDSLSAMPQTAGSDVGNQDPLASPFVPREAVASTGASGGVDRSNPFGGSASAGHHGRTTPSRTARSVSTKGGRGSSGEPDLMATLLGNIQAQGNEASALDSLIRKMEADDASAVTSDQLTARASNPVRSQHIQAKLRACPKPNTAKGLKCRQDICALHAGRDAACPAN